MFNIYDNQNDTYCFNMTGIIDIVFLLIIFFMLVCQFIVAENFDVDVPDDISSARPGRSNAEQMTTVTVMNDAAEGVIYAVGSEKISAHIGSEISVSIAGEIDKQLRNLPLSKRIVSLRIDKDIAYRYSQHALAGISQSTATDIKLAVTKQKHLQ